MVLFQAVDRGGLVFFVNDEIGDETNDKSCFYSHGLLVSQWV
jgi:hypothetical protein